MLIVGAGGLAAQLFEDLPAMNLPGIVFWSETETKYSFIKEKYKVVSTDEEVKEYFNTVSRSFIVCVGDTANRVKMAEKFRNLGGELATFIMPGSSISSYATIGEGTMVLKDVDIEPGAIIGRECLLNKQTNFGHDCIVSPFCEIGPTSLVSAGSEIGENSLVGMGSIILPKIRIGKNVIISAGSIVTKNIPDNAVVSGNPAVIRFYRKK
jgi:sugar O-acyltransferase (sialic acid O-acetyltransferase NeuD family)